MENQGPKTVILKFGGAALATIEQFDHIANIILEKKREYPRVVCVVSAMGSMTDELISLAYKVNPNPPQREYDMLISIGERMSMALLAMALSKKDAKAVSFTGSQAGIITCINHSHAKIIDVRPHRIEKELADDSIVIIAGFQGVSSKGEITTLGRGGSDTSAVALGIALYAECVEYYKDVAGIFDKDPKKNDNAQLMSSLTYEHALNIVQKGAKILHERALLLAQKHNIPLCVRSFLSEIKQEHGTMIAPTQQRSAVREYEI